MSSSTLKKSSNLRSGEAKTSSAAEIQLLRDKISELVTLHPSKTAKILSLWINGDPTYPSSNKKK